MAHNGDGDLSPFRFHSHPPPGRRGSLHDKDLAHSPPPKRRHPGLNIFFLLLSTAVNKASGCNEIPAELFTSLKEDANKVLHSLYVSKSGRPSSGHRTGKGQFSSQFPRRIVTKNVLTTGQSHSSPMLVRSCLTSCVLGFSIM